MRIIVFCGLPGSGKSTHATKLEPHYQIINQDLLGSRQNCLKRAEHHLKLGLDIIIDRTNINKKQRNHWIELGKKYDAEMHCVEFKSDPNKCIERITKREDHPTITKETPLAKVTEIVLRFVNEYEEPAFHEGFNSISVIHSDNIIS